MLEKIIQHKIQEIDTLKRDQNITLSEVISMSLPKRNFEAAMLEKINLGKNAVIAELKRCSPSKGYLDKDLNIEVMAKLYEDSGAACISVLTDYKFFKGSSEDLRFVKNITNIPILRKDFILDKSQLIESKLMGADCILLIIACLSEDRFKELLKYSSDLDLDVLVEVHDKNELRLALKYNCRMIGINNRNLKTFNVSVETTIELRKLIVEDNLLVISESGIKNTSIIADLNQNNINAFLVGESLVTDKKPATLLQNMVG